jgi:RNase H-fold protein (predicted Holliday junction resolvase)
MHKVMALDVGTKRIGIALSDYLQVIAVPHSFISRQPERYARFLNKLAKNN